MWNLEWREDAGIEEGFLTSRTPFGMTRAGLRGHGAQPFAAQGKQDAGATKRSPGEKQILRCAQDDKFPVMLRPYILKPKLDSQERIYEDRCGQGLASG